eukprot:355559-Chlamydomonas_euryale.AAC.3
MNEGRRWRGCMGGHSVPAAVWQRRRVEGYERGETVEGDAWADTVPLQQAGGNLLAVCGAALSLLHEPVGAKSTAAEPSDAQPAAARTCLCV